MLTDLNTYLNKAIPDTRLTIKKYLDVKFEYLVSAQLALHRKPPWGLVPHEQPVLRAGQVAPVRVTPDLGCGTRRKAGVVCQFFWSRSSTHLGVCRHQGTLTRLLVSGCT